MAKFSYEREQSAGKGRVESQSSSSMENLALFVHLINECKLFYVVGAFHY